MTLRSWWCWLALSLAAPAAVAQEPEAAPPVAPAARPPAAAAEQPTFVVRRYPRDRDAAIAIVGSRTLTLGDLVDHLDGRHYPGFKRALELRPEIQRMLQSDLIAPWTRQFADLEALRQTLGDQQPDAAALEAAQSEALRKHFQTWLDAYVADRERSGRTTELSQHRINALLADYQLRSGLAAELQGMLDLLEPDDFTRGQLHAYFNDNARVFGGQVTIAHILVQHRDGGTGILLNDDGIARASAKLADIKARLRPDGSNFEEIARLFSDDTRTARDGGRLAGVRRFDDRLPAALCRAAWQLRDGELGADVVETQYGWHLVKRLDFAQNIYILFTDDAIPSIRIVLRRARQEARLFGAREATGVRLLL